MRHTTPSGQHVNITPPLHGVVSRHHVTMSYHNTTSYQVTTSSHATKSPGADTTQKQVPFERGTFNMQCALVAALPSRQHQGSTRDTYKLVLKMPLPQDHCAGIARARNPGQGTTRQGPLSADHRAGTIGRDDMTGITEQAQHSRYHRGRDYRAGTPGHHHRASTTELTQEFRFCDFQS